MSAQRRWRPEPWWVGAGLLLGGAAGIPVGALWGRLLFALPGEPLVGLSVGGSFGLMHGAFVGLGVGLLLPLLVMAAVAGAVTRRWVAGRMPDRPRVVRR